MDVMKKLEGLQNGAEFEQALESVKSAEELQELLKKHGVDLTQEEVTELLTKLSKQTGDELDENALEDVAGGVITNAWLIKAVVKWIIKNGRWIQVIAKK